MDLANIPILSVLLALVATFLGLAVLVQIVQEVYKHLTSSKARTYNMVLKDFLGPWITQLSNYGGFSNLEIRGPFQFLRRWPSGKTLPFEKKELIHALEKTITPWHQRTLQIIKLEVELQSGEEQRPSQSWKAFLKEMTSVHRGMTGYWSAREVVDFLETWDHKV